MSNLIEVPCSNCSKILKVPESRAGQTGRCAYCGDSIIIPDIENTNLSPNKPYAQKTATSPVKEFQIPKAKSTASYVRPRAKQQSKSSTSTIIFIVISFIIGNTTGYYFSTEISEVLGLPQDQNIPKKENSTENSSIENKTTVDSNNSPEIILDPGANNSNNTGNDDFLLSMVDKWEKEVKILDEETKSLNKIVNILFQKYDLNTDNQIFKNIEQAEDSVRKIEDICIQTRKAIETKSVHAQKQFKIELENLSSNHEILNKLQADKAKLQEQLNGLNEWHETQQREVSDKNMGEWYRKLSNVISSLEKTYETVNIRTSHSAIKYRSINLEMQRIRNYPKQVTNVVQNLDNTVKKGNDPYLWIKNRRENAKSISQQKQAEYLEKFLQQNNKLDIEIETEYRALAIAVKNIKNKNEKDLASKTILSKILQELQVLNRKWEEEFQIFDSAVSNFSIQ